MIVWRSDRVTAGTAAYGAAQSRARSFARSINGRAEWVDEYNDYSVRGVWVVRDR